VGRRVSSEDQSSSQHRSGGYEQRRERPHGTDGCGVVPRDHLRCLAGKFVEDWGHQKTPGPQAIGDLRPTCNLLNSNAASRSIEVSHQGWCQQGTCRWHLLCTSLRSALWVIDEARKMDSNSQHFQQCRYNKFSASETCFCDACGHCSFWWCSNTLTHHHKSSRPRKK